MLKQDGKGPPSGANGPRDGQGSGKGKGQAPGKGVGQGKGGKKGSCKYNAVHSEVPTFPLHNKGLKGNRGTLVALLTPVPYSWSYSISFCNQQVLSGSLIHD